MLEPHLLTQAEKRDVIADQLRDTPYRADLWIAEDLGVDQKTVKGVRQLPENWNLQFANPEHVFARDGRQIPENYGTEFANPEHVFTRAASLPRRKGGMLSRIS